MSAQLAPSTDREAAGRAAYEADVARTPLYHNGRPRLAWRNLDAVAKASWVKNPTPRD